jgi:hypothetical protein
MAKSLKTINGVKLLKRHSAASFFTGLFSLVIIGALVTLYFLPFFSVVNKVDATNPVKTTIGNPKFSLTI